MGWGFSYEDDFKSWVKELLRAWESDTHTYYFPKYALRGRVLWALQEVTEKTTGRSTRRIACILVHRPKHTRSGDVESGWGEKGIPAADGGLTCPMTFINEATPQDDRERQWMCEVRARHARTSRAGFKLGDWVRLANVQSWAKYLRVTSLKPFRCGSYRVARRLIDGKAVEMTALQQKVDTFTATLPWPVKPACAPGWTSSDAYKAWQTAEALARPARNERLRTWAIANPPGLPKEQWYKLTLDPQIQMVWLAQWKKEHEQISICETVQGVAGS